MLYTQENAGVENRCQFPCRRPKIPLPASSAKFPQAADFTEVFGIERRLFDSWEAFLPAGREMADEVSSGHGTRRTRSC
jgi:hypothetical protein